MTREDFPQDDTEDIQQVQQLDFRTVNNAYWNPGYKGQGSTMQHQCLQRMGQVAQSFVEWSEVYKAASGDCLNSVWRDRLATDPVLAEVALEKIEELKEGASIEDLVRLEQSAAYRVREIIREVLQRRGIALQDVARMRDEFTKQWLKKWLAEIGMDEEFIEKQF